MEILASLILFAIIAIILLAINIHYRKQIDKICDTAQDSIHQPGNEATEKSEEISNKANAVFEENIKKFEELQKIKEQPEEKGDYMEKEQPHQKPPTIYDIAHWEVNDGKYTLRYIYSQSARSYIDSMDSEYKFVNKDDNLHISIVQYKLCSSDLDIYNIKSPISGVFRFCVAETNDINTGEEIAIIDTSEEALEEFRQWERAEMERKAKEQKEREERLEKIEKEEIARKIKEKHRRRQLEKIVRQELIDSGELFGEQPKRPPIPREVVDAVYKRDGGRCVYCGSTENLQIDHIIPFSKGGDTCVENLQLLCRKCNLEKSNKIG